MKRIQLSRKKGHRKPADAVNVARPTKWGNPFHVVPGVEGASRGDAVRRYEAMLQAADSPKAKWILDHIHELRGKDLACWCPLDEPCHADVLIKLANERRH